MHIVKKEIHKLVETGESKNIWNNLVGFIDKSGTFLLY